MDDQQFKDEVALLGGTPPEFFEHPELMDLFLPLLKNDFRIAETAIDLEAFSKVDFGITIFTGQEDDLTKDQVAGWHQYTTDSCKIHTFEGGHFFIYHYLESIAYIINNTVTNLLLIKDFGFSNNFGGSG